MTENTSPSWRPILAIALSLVLLIGLWLGLGPQYGIYVQKLRGEAQLKEAEYTRRIAVLEAQAKLDSAKLQAQAEVERARGVAQSNQIIGNSLKENETYLQWLWITSVAESQNQSDRTVIYIPTEKGIPLPALEAGRLLQEKTTAELQPPLSFAP